MQLHESKILSTGIMITYIAPMVIDYMKFSTNLKGNLHEFVDTLEIIRKDLKKISGYQFDNPHFRVSNIYGTEFAFQIHEKSKWNNVDRKFDGLGIFELSMWDYTGGTAIFDGVIPADNRQEFIDGFLAICDKWSIGEKKCSDCKKWINYAENRSHRYFAGIYCSECWERKWKAVEAAENYN